MDAILILLIISIQFAIVYFSTKWLTSLDKKLVDLTEKIDTFSKNAETYLKQARNIFEKINLGFEKFYKHQNKLKVYRNIILVKSVIVAIILYKKRKNLLNFFSVYGAINKFTKTLMGI